MLPVPSSSELVVITSGPGAPMARLKVWLWVCGVGLESRTATVKVEFPINVGLPEITPELVCNVRPGGSEPTVRLHAYGGTPPLASICAR